MIALSLEQAMAWVVAGAACLLAAVAALAIVLLRRHSRGADAEDTSDPERLLTAIEAARDELDAKADRLELLIREADARIETLSGEGPADGRYEGRGSRNADSQRGEILHLSRQGLSATDIARRTGRDIGEVELVIHIASPGRQV